MRAAEVTLPDKATPAQRSGLSGSRVLLLLLGMAAFATMPAPAQSQSPDSVPAPPSPGGVTPFPAGTGTGPNNGQYPGQYPNQYPGQYPSAGSPSRTGETPDLNGSQSQRDSVFNPDARNAGLRPFPRKPDVPTEFQRLVATTVGRNLPIFGASLFDDVPSTFAPVEDIPVTEDYVLGPGDQVRLQVWGQVNFQGAYTVDRTGAIALPDLGAIHVAGLQFSQLTPYLRSRLERVYRNFDLNVNMGQLRSIQVFVVGQARRPGSYTVSSLSTLLNALFASGGPLPQGSLRHIQVRRAGRVVTDFDLYDLLLHGDKSKDVPLASGDVVFIPEAGPEIAVVGSVNNSALYELRGETNVAQALALAGGKTSLAEGSRVRLERLLDHSNRSTVDVDLSSSTLVSVQDGDILYVPEIVGRFKDTVTLRGNVASPGRYVWHAGMRITDLIPSKEALVTRDYWLKRNQLGQSETYLGPPEPTPVKPEPYPVTSGETSTQKTPEPGSNQQRGSTRGQQPNPSAEVRKADADTGASSIGEALSGDRGIFAPRNYVILSAPDINWSYAVIERQSPVDLTTSLIPFSLGKIILDGDQSQNLTLQSGDLVTIFSKADLRVPTGQRTRFVRLEGEFNAAGVYSVLPGESLRSLVQRAGGFTEDAYLYASEFTRESTRRVQQQRLREYADQLEAQVNASTAQGSTRAINERDAAAALTSGEDARVSISRLRRLTPIGRIVLEVKPDSRGVESLPDLALEDGDRFVVPRVPANVTVEGQVYSANAFVFTRGHHVLDYLKQAGGPDRLADRSREFVLRADGSVYSRQYGNVERARVFPGDTIVIPPRLHTRAVLRDLIDIATIVGQFGIGAAAIRVLK